ncbi:hypothetical protein ACFLVH_05185 [Chloroflexota bacterium]
MANLPMDREDECLKYASIYTRLLDLELPYLVYKEDVGHGSDFQIFYSQGVGVGITCLIASKYLGIPFDQLEPIPGPGTRFDYRGQSGNLKCIFESRGTKYEYTQDSQIEGGIDKKAICKKRGDQFDIGLVISTFIGTKPETPQIVIADPEYKGIMFGKNNDIYYRFRHFARVMQFIGATPLSRELYVESNNILWERRSKRFFFKEDNLYPVKDMPEIEVDKSLYIGRWSEDWIPSKSFRYKRLKSIKLPKLLDSRPKAKVSIFQGLLKMNFQAITEGYLEDITINKGENLGITTQTHEGEIASIFPDGTVLIFRVNS